MLCPVFIVKYLVQYHDNNRNDSVELQYFQYHPTLPNCMHVYKMLLALICRLIILDGLFICIKICYRIILSRHKTANIIYYAPNNL